MAITWIEKEYVKMLGNPYANLNFEEEDEQVFVIGDVFEFQDSMGSQMVMVTQIAPFKHMLIELSTGNRWSDETFECRPQMGVKNQLGIPMSWIKKVLLNGSDSEDMEMRSKTFRKIENVYRTMREKEMGV